MTVPPPEPGLPPSWNRPPTQGAWAADAPPAGLPPQNHQGHPAQGYPDQAYPAPGYPPPGNGPQGYPAPAYPAPGFPPPYQGQPPAQRGTNGFAIASLIFGIIAGVLLAVIFGIIALSQIKKTGQGGRGLAIAGLVLSGLWTAGIVTAIIVAVSTSASRNDAGQITSGGSVSATALKAGDCVNNLKDSTSLLSLPAVPCAQPHEGEVFAVFDLPAGPYPGRAAVSKQVTDECTGRIAAYSPAAGSDGTFGLFSVYPLPQNWDAGDREVACLATGLSGPTTGSIKGR